MRIAFLGPFGTFTEQAVWQVAPAGSELVPVTSARQALDSVRMGEVDRAVVPIENSIEGGVNATIDALSSGDPLVIVSEMIVPVSFVFAALPGTNPSDIRHVGTHPHAWAQCRIWVEDNYPGAVHVPTTSTAAAPKLLAEHGDASFEAVLCSQPSADRYGLHVIASEVADNPGAVTRFIMVAKPGFLPSPTGADKTTVQVRLADDEAGALLSMLEQFSARGVNLSRIESRPSGNGLGSYSFSIDIAGHAREERVQAALIGLHRTCPEVIFLGSYPRVDRIRTEIKTGTSDADFSEARRWISQILS
jgi:Prephenate dehydratase